MNNTLTTTELCKMYNLDYEARTLGTKFTSYRKTEKLGSTEKLIAHWVRRPETVYALKHNPNGAYADDYCTTYVKAYDFAEAITVLRKTYPYTYVMRIGEIESWPYNDFVEANPTQIILTDPYTGEWDNVTEADLLQAKIDQLEKELKKDGIL